MNDIGSFDFGPEPIPFTHKNALGDGPFGHNLYFAVLPDNSDIDNVAATARDICNSEGLPRPQPPSVYHITLRWIWASAKVTDDIVAQAARIGARVKMPPFDFNLTHYQSFGGDAVVLNPDQNVPELEALLAKIDDALKSVGVKPKRVTLNPHLTIAYDEKWIERTPLLKPLALKVREFVLVDSVIGAGRHNYLGRYPLRD